MVSTRHGPERQYIPRLTTRSKEKSKTNRTKQTSKQQPKPNQNKNKILNKKAFPLMFEMATETARHAFSEGEMCIQRGTPVAHGEILKLYFALNITVLNFPFVCGHVYFSHTKKL